MCFSVILRLSARRLRQCIYWTISTPTYKTAIYCKTVSCLQTNNMFRPRHPSLGIEGIAVLLLPLLILLYKAWSRFLGGHAVAQLVEALRYMPEGREFDFRWCHWNFSLTKSFRPNDGPGVDSASNKNEYQEYFLGGKGCQCVGLTTLQTSYANFLDIWKPQPPGTL